MKGVYQAYKVPGGFLQNLGGSLRVDKTASTLLDVINKSVTGIDCISSSDKNSGIDSAVAP